MLVVHFYDFKSERAGEYERERGTGELKNSSLKTMRGCWKVSWMLIEFKNRKRDNGFPLYIVSIDK